MLNRQIFNKGWILLTGAFPEYLKGLTPEQIKTTVGVYWESLKDFADIDFQKVVKNHINQNKYFPKIADLRTELVRLRGFNRPTAANEWDRLIKAAESGAEPDMAEVTEKALRVCGGWSGFSRMTYKDLQFHRKDFERIYNENLERHDRQVLIGSQGEDQKQIEVLK